MSRSRAFVFTIHNFNEDAESLLQSNYFSAQYLVYGYEVGGVTGRPHLQGYVYFANARSFDSVRKELIKLGDPFLEQAKGDPNQNYDYCSKDGNYLELGVRPKSQKEKGQLATERWESARLAAIEGRFNDIPADLYIRYHSAIRRIHEERNVPIPTNLIEELRPWQRILKEELEGPVHNRKVIWYHDAIGNTGKSAMADFIVFRLGGFKIPMGKSVDLAYALPDNPKIIVFDLVRKMEDHVNYGFMEACKNGSVFSPKFHSKMRYFPQPHVVIFSNFMPDMRALSEDRWDIRELTNFQNGWQTKV